MADIENPLTEQDLANINAALVQADQAKGLLRKAQAAGFDMPDLDADIAKARDRLVKIKRTFFPGSE